MDDTGLQSKQIVRALEELRMARDLNLSGYIAMKDTLSPVGNVRIQRFDHTEEHIPSPTRANEN